MDWWGVAGARKEPSSVRLLLDWNNPPNYTIALDMNAYRIDLERDPQPDTAILIMCY